MNSPIISAIVLIFALSLAISALYVSSERDELTSTFYGSSHRLLVPTNSSVTIPLGGVSDRFEVDSLTTHLDSWTSYPSWNRSCSIKRPAYYTFSLGLFVAVQVNKSAFVLLEDYTSGNRTVGTLPFASNGHPSGNFGYLTESMTTDIELNHLYQLKIGNYETFLINQSGPVEFTIHNTSRSLEVIIPSPAREMDRWAPPSYRVTIVFHREANPYLVSGLLLTDAGLSAIHFVTIRKEDARP